MYKKIIYLFILLFSFNSVTLAQEKIAFVDLNFIFNNSNVGKKINKEINEKSEKLKTDFDEYQKKLDEEKNKLLAQKNVLAKEEFDKKIFDLEKKVKDYNFQIQKKNRDLTNYRNKARIQFLKETQNILAAYSKDNSISMILKKESILIGKTDLDITNQILDFFNKNVKKINIQ